MSSWTEYRNFTNAEYWIIRYRQIVPDLRRRPEGRGSHAQIALKGAKIIDYCLFNPSVEGAWIDQKAQKLLGTLNKRARSASE